MPSDIRLRYLFSAAKLGSMRAASEELDVAASSVSRQIAELESELGIPLIEKGVRRIKLTEAGELTCMYYREKSSQEEAFLSKIAELKSIRAGKVVLAVGEAFITRSFSDVLRDFMQSYPGIVVNVQVANTNKVIELVREDEAHIGLVFDIPRDPKIRTRLTLPQPLKVILNKNHPFAKKKLVKLPELVSQGISLPEDAYRIRQLIRTAEHDEGIFLEPIMKTNSLALITDLVISGQGMTILPELVVQQQLTDGILIALPTSNKTLNSTKTSLITRLGRQLPIGAYRLLLSIESYLKNAVTGR